MNKTIVAVALSMASATALAQDKGWYVGGAFGQSKAQDFCTGIPNRTSCDSSEITLKAIGGYQFTPNFALETGLSGVGEFEASNPAVRARIAIGIAEGVAVGILPLSEGFSVFGKVGLYSSNVETRTETILGGTTIDDNRGSDLTYGAGVGFAISRKLQLRGEWQRYQDVDAGNAGKTDVDVLTLGLVYRFY